MPPKRSKQSKDNASLTTPPLAAVVPLEKRGGRGVSARVLAVNQTQRSLRSLKKGVTFNVPDSASSVHNTETGGSVVKAGSANDTLDEPTGSNDQSDERMPESAPKNKTNKDSLTADTLAAPGTSINQSKPKSFQHKASPKSHLPTVAHKATSTRKKCEVIRLDLSESEDLDGKTADFDIEEDSCDDDSEESTDEDVPAKIIKQAIASNETGKRKDKKDPIDVKGMACGESQKCSNLRPTRFSYCYLDGSQ